MSNDLIFKLWVRVEVYDPAADEHTDLDPDHVEFKVGEYDSLDEVADFINNQAPYNDFEETLEELQYALEEVFPNATNP